MAELLLPLLDPTVVPAPLEDNEHVFTFSQAKKVDARLPGGLYYFHMDRPRLPSHSLEFRQKQQNYVRFYRDRYGFTIFFTRFILFG